MTFMRTVSIIDISNRESRRIMEALAELYLTGEFNGTDVCGDMDPYDVFSCEGLESDASKAVGVTRVLFREADARLSDGSLTVNLGSCYLSYDTSAMTEEEARARLEDVFGGYSDDLIREAEKAGLVRGLSGGR